MFFGAQFEFGSDISLLFLQFFEFVDGDVELSIFGFELGGLVLAVVSG